MAFWSRTRNCSTWWWSSRSSVVGAAVVDRSAARVISHLLPDGADGCGAVAAGCRGDRGRVHVPGPFRVEGAHPVLVVGASDVAGFLSARHRRVRNLWSGEARL